MKLAAATPKSAPASPIPTPKGMKTPSTSSSQPKLATSNGMDLDEPYMEADVDPEVRFLYLEITLNRLNPMT
jgi:hypothetical protein